MEFNRHVCGGRIEELTGKKAKLLPIDIYFRTLGFYKIARQEYEKSSPDERLALDSFAEGVNAYISNRRPEELSLNYTILGLTGVKFKIETWSPLDTLTIAKLIAWDFGLSRDIELTRVKLYAVLGSEMAEQFLVPHPWPYNYHPTIIGLADVHQLEKVSASILQPTVEKFEANYADITHHVFNDPAPDISSVTGNLEGIGSNSWVATGKITQSGGSLLADDLHMGLPMPSFWYEIDLHCPDNEPGHPFHVAGFTLSSNPLVIVGHNNDIAWGNTNVYPDVNDQYSVKVNPDNSLQYEWNGKWRNMNVHHESISFGDGKPSINIRIRATHLGPIINENKYDAKTGSGSGFNNKDPRAQRWTALEPGHITRAVIGMNKARNWNEFRAALKYLQVPAQSFLFADKQGNIGYQMSGKIPIRPKNFTGQVTTPGWSEKYEWKGYLPYNMLPHAYNPARGFIVAANQEVAPAEYYEFLQRQLGPDVNGNFGSKYNRWTYEYRAKRIYDLIKELAPNTIDSFQKIQGDNKYLSADEVLPYLTNLKFGSQELTDARNWMLKWDRRFDENNPHACLYAEFWLKMMKNTSRTNWVT